MNRSFFIFLLSILVFNPGFCHEGPTLKLGLLKYNGGGDWYSNPTSLMNLALFCNKNLNTPVSYTHLRAHETVLDLVCRLLLEKKKIPRHYTVSEFDHMQINHPQTDMLMDIIITL